jgi:hypothetical protein
MVKSKSNALKASATPGVLVSEKALLALCSIGANLEDVRLAVSALYQCAFAADEKEGCSPELIMWLAEKISAAVDASTNALHSLQTKGAS